MNINDLQGFHVDNQNYRKCFRNHISLIWSITSQQYKAIIMALLFIIFDILNCLQVSFAIDTPFDISYYSSDFINLLFLNEQFLLLPQCFQLYLTINKPSFMEIFRFFSLCLQSCLLQFCCMWERVKNSSFLFAKYLVLLNARVNKHC